MSAASWLAYVAIGGLALWLMRHTQHPTLDAVLVRLAAICAVGAGMVGAHGWVGTIIGTVVHALTSAAATVGAAAVGTSILWLVAAALGVAWIAAMVPTKWINYDPADWLIGAGLVLPALLVSVPGALGEGMRTVVLAGGHLATSVVTGLVS